MENFLKLIRIVDALKEKYENGGNLIIRFNDHTTNYESVESYLSDEFYKSDNDAQDLIRKEKCILLNKVVDIQIYPVWGHTFISTFSDNLEDASRIMIDDLKNYSEDIKSIVEHILEQK